MRDLLEILQDVVRLLSFQPLDTGRRQQCDDQQRRRRKRRNRR